MLRNRGIPLSHTALETVLGPPKKGIPGWPLGRLENFSAWRWQQVRKILRDQATHGGIDWLQIEPKSKRARRRERGRQRNLKS